MTFAAGNLALLFAGGAGAAKTYKYVTTDTLPTVQASGYFDSTVAGMLNIGDVIEVTVVDAVSKVSRTSVTGVTRLVVATNNGTTVTTTQALPAGAVVATTATSLSVTAALHAGRTIVVNSAAPIAVTMPAATGTGAKYHFVIGVAATATGHTIKVANATDVMTGHALCVTTTSTNAEGFATSATSDTVTLNGTTLGGVVGDRVELIDIATGIFSVLVVSSPTGTEATPFTATVS